MASSISEDNGTKCPMKIDLETFDKSPYKKEQKLVFDGYPEISVSILHPKNDKLEDAMVLITGKSGTYIMPLLYFGKNVMHAKK